MALPCSSGPLVLDVQSGQLIAAWPGGLGGPLHAHQHYYGHVRSGRQLRSGIGEHCGRFRSRRQPDPHRPRLCSTACRTNRWVACASARMPPAPPCPYSIDADFSSISSPSQLVEVWNGSTLLASFPGQCRTCRSGRALARMGSASSPPATECYVGTWKPPVHLLINGINFTATELRVLAESPAGTSLGFQDRLRPRHRGDRSYVITSETFGPANGTSFTRASGITRRATPACWCNI